MTETPKRLGRPRSPDGPRKGHMLDLSEDERTIIDAARGRQPRATFIRDAAVAHAMAVVCARVEAMGKKPEEAHVTEARALAAQNEGAADEDEAAKALAGWR
jgi:regulator of extracellular matrix RemA (YlzA/DUF370 family)